MHWFTRPWIPQNEGAVFGCSDDLLAVGRKVPACDGGGVGREDVKGITCWLGRKARRCRLMIRLVVMGLLDAN